MLTAPDTQPPLAQDLSDVTDEPSSVPINLSPQSGAADRPDPLNPYTEYHTPNFIHPKKEPHDARSRTPTKDSTTSCPAM